MLSCFISIRLQVCRFKKNSNIKIMSHILNRVTFLVGTKPSHIASHELTNMKPSPKTTGPRVLSHELTTMKPSPIPLAKHNTDMIKALQGLIFITYCQPPIFPKILVPNALPEEMIEPSPRKHKAILQLRKST